MCVLNPSSKPQAEGTGAPEAWVKEEQPPGESYTPCRILCTPGRAGSREMPRFNPQVQRAEPEQAQDQQLQELAA